MDSDQLGIWWVIFFKYIFLSWLYSNGDLPIQNVHPRKVLFGLSKLSRVGIYYFTEYILLIMHSALKSGKKVQFWEVAVFASMAKINSLKKIERSHPEGPGEWRKSFL